jgi:hypothetical protein
MWHIAAGQNKLHGLSFFYRDLPGLKGKSFRRYLYTMWTGVRGGRSAYADRKEPSAEDPGNQASVSANYGS